MRVSMVSNNLQREEPKRQSPMAIRNNPYYQAESEIKVMDGPFCIGNVVILDKKSLDFPENLSNLKMHQRLMLKITQVFEDHSTSFKMANDCKLHTKNSVDLEIR